MTAPADNYTLAAGSGGGRGGRFKWPAWRRGIAKNTWGIVPGNKLSDVNPENNAAINPNGAGNQAPWHRGAGQEGIITDWGSAAWDELRGCLDLPPQGGHSGYGGNEPYSIDLMQDVPQFRMLRKPSGAIGNLLSWPNVDPADVTGVYGDGRPRPGHPYNNHVAIPGEGPITMFIYAPFPDSHTSAKIFQLNPTTGESTLLLDPQSLPNGFGQSPTGGADYDPTRNCIWMVNSGTTSLIKFDKAAGAYSSYGYPNNIAAAYIQVKYIKEYDLLAVLHHGGAGYKQYFFLWDLANNFAIIEPTITGDWSVGLDSSNYGACGMDWTGTELHIWGNFSNTEQISTLTPTGNLRTAPWVKGIRSPAAGNIIIPTVAQANGTFNRFWYSSKLAGCGLLNAVNQPIHFYATE